MVASKKTLADKLEDGRHYEIGYLLSPAVSETALEDTVSKLLVAPITATSGEVEEQELPTLITLAYPIRKTVDHKTSVFTNAFFGHLRFIVEPSAIAKLAAKYQDQSEILRFLIIERPPVVVPLVVGVGPKRSIEREVISVGEVKPPALDAAALDREIDQLLLPTN